MFLKSAIKTLLSWWVNAGNRFAASQWRRLIVGCGTGCLVAIFMHLIWRDRLFGSAIEKKWSEAPEQKLFDGFSAYQLELRTLAAILVLAIVFWALAANWRYLRAWWAGITSFTFILALLLTTAILFVPQRSKYWLAAACLVIGFNVGVELWRSISGKDRFPRSIPALDIPKAQQTTDLVDRWHVSSGDDPIAQWNQDIIGRTAVVELLAEHIFANRTPIVALNGGLGDGKSSVLNLLSRSLKHNAITVTFSAWLPGSDETFALDLFRDIATECKRWLYIPQLRKQAVGYARKISGSVSYLSGLKEFLPAQSQQDEINEVRETLARVPLPIVVLLDEVDRMQRDEILVLLKVLRGAASIPNVTFVCAFSEVEIRNQMSSGGAQLSYDYLEKFFPVKIHLAPPNPALVGKFLQDKVTTAAKRENWFLGTNEKRFAELFTYMWQESLSHVCTNLRKAGLLLNDFMASARTIGREVNTFDLIGIEAVRRFEPEVYQLIRRNSVYLTYGSGSPEGPYISDRRKTEEGVAFFTQLEDRVSKTNEPTAMRGILRLLFPQYIEAGKDSRLMRGSLRPTNGEIAETEKRICNADYFAIFVRAAIPEEMYSETELSRIISHLNASRTEAECERIFSDELNGIPAKHAKREDFLWKIGRAIETRINELSAEALAYAAADHATDYAYDLMNIGEAARALNIVFESAQKISATSKAQTILLEAMKRATDDTFARRLLEYTEGKDRNKVLTNFKNIDAVQVRLAFMDRMRARYGNAADASKVDVSRGDWWAFRWWADNSTDDADAEKDFWRRFIGSSRKKLAQALNFAFPTGFTWSEDPRSIMEKILPLDDVRKWILELGQEELDAVEMAGITRFLEMLDGKWLDIRRLG